MARLPDPEKKQMILRAAIVTFTKEGFEKTTIAQIAECAGMATAQVYTYYESKEALLLATVHKMILNHSEGFKKLARRAGTVDVETFLGLYFDELLEIRVRVLFIIHVVFSPHLQDLFKGFDFEYIDVFGPYLKNLPTDEATAVRRTLMALADSYFCVGDMATSKHAAILVLNNALAKTKNG